MLTKRLEILFDPKELEMIRKKAKAEGKSIANLVRETLKEKIIEKGMKQKEKIPYNLTPSHPDTLCPIPWRLTL